MSPRVSGLVALALLIGCGTDPAPSPDFLADPVTISPNSVWAGATVTLRSGAFSLVGVEELGLSLDGAALTPMVVDDTTLSIVIPPATSAGPHHLNTTLPGAPEDLGGMYVYGWAGTTSGTTMISTDVVPWPIDVPTGVLAGSGANGRTVTYIPANSGGTVLTYAGLEANDGYGTSTSYQPGVIIDRTGRVTQLHPLDSGWTMLDSAVTNTRNLYQLSAEVWLRTGNHESRFVSDSTFLNMGDALQTESPWLLARSLPTHRATFVLSAATPELQILNTETGAVATTVPGIVGTQAAVFSPDGASLFLAAGPHWWGPYSITRVNPTNGAILATDSVHVGVYALATHSARPGLLFELDKAANDTWLLRIRNGADLSIVAELGSDTPAESCSGVYNALIIDGGTTARAFINRCQEGYRVVNWQLMPGA